MTIEGLPANVCPGLPCQHCLEQGVYVPMIYIDSDAAPDMGQRVVLDNFECARCGSMDGLIRSVRPQNRDEMHVKSKYDEVRKEFRS